MVAPPSHPHEMATQIVGINVGESSPSGSGSPARCRRVVAAFAPNEQCARSTRDASPAEITPVSVKHRKGEPKIFEVDDGAPRYIMEKLAALKPHYQEGEPSPR